MKKILRKPVIWAGMLGGVALVVALAPLTLTAQTKPAATKAASGAPNGPPDGSPPSLKSRFDEIDTNKDGAISRAELETFRKKREKDCGGPGRFVKFDKKGPGRGPEGPRGGPDGPRLMGPPDLSQLDTNKDGKISLEEFLAPPKQAFERFDANHDGVLTRDERPVGPPPGGQCGPDMPPPPPGGATPYAPPKP